MQRLILLRHAEAERQSLSGDDFDRGLTLPAAPRRKPSAGGWPNSAIAPTWSLVSTARRANETWAALEAAFPGVRVEPEPELYEATPKTLLRAAEEAGEAGTVMLVAAQSGPALPGAQAGRPPVRWPAACRTGHAAVFAFDPGRTPSFEALVAP